MDEIFRGFVQFLHVLTGLLWLGGGFYTIFVQTPALMSAPVQARGPVLGQIVPRQLNYLLRLGEITILTGIVNVFASGRGRLLEDVFGSRWAATIAVGAILAIVLLGVGHAIIKPSATRLLTLGPLAASGDPTAASQVAAIIDRLRRAGYAQIFLGVAIIALMVVARFS